MIEPNSDRQPDRPRIFGIGLNKTGTTSFHSAMTILGFQSLHNGGSDVHDAVQRAIDADAPLLSNLDPRFDAFSDIGLLSRRFRRLDVQYPGSYFVLTTRTVDDWIESRRRHVEYNQQRRAAGKYLGAFLSVDEAKWRTAWKQHLDSVRRYFDGTEDLGVRRCSRFLEIDLTRNAAWGPLCTFLGLAEPDGPFPWSNSQRERQAVSDTGDHAS